MNGKLTIEDVTPIPYVAIFFFRSKFHFQIW